MGKRLHKMTATAGKRWLRGTRADGHWDLIGLIGAYRGKPDAVAVSAYDTCTVGTIRDVR
jgi:hypothetical protein